MLEVSPLSTGNGNGAASDNTVNSLQITSIAPVGIALFSLPLGRATTSPTIKTHHSARSAPATDSSEITTCTAPVASLKSINATPP